jgi:hypothetical protein
VDEWVRRQQAEDPSRAERFQLMCDLLPFPRDAATRISNYPWSAPYEDVKVKDK